MQLLINYIYIYLSIYLRDHDIYYHKANDILMPLLGYGVAGLGLALAYLLLRQEVMG
ncbi:MAG: hypothetical protein MIO93_01395 [ANME-2 cluster archaeon]|nr:hypothetical protein [ANME-2 cluster archaeon]